MFNAILLYKYQYLSRGIVHRVDRNFDESQVLHWPENEFPN